MQEHVRLCSTRRAARRRRGLSTRWSLSLVGVLCACVCAWMCGGVKGAAVEIVEMEMKTPVVTMATPSMATSKDVVVAGGIDGKVYALNAWTGDLMWMLDSGGPMIDSSMCGPQPTAAESQVPEEDGEIKATTINADGTVSAEDDRLVPIHRDGMGALATAGLTTQMMPMYDGRLFQVSKGAARELEMTMADIINANGPVRLMDDATGRPSDVLLFGDKKTEVFSLDAQRGIMNPYLSSRAGEIGTKHFLFGRSVFKTKAVHSINASATQCFTISEYFLQLAEPPRCAVDEDETAKLLPPRLVVVHGDRYADDEHEASSIAAFDPRTDEQLWEVQLPQFDVLAVFGVSTETGGKFFQWTMAGPSSTSIRQRPRLASAELKRDSTPENDEMHDGRSVAKHVPVARTVLRRKKTIDGSWKLRTLEGSFFLQAASDAVNNLSGEGAAPSEGSTFLDDPDDFDIEYPVITGRKHFVTYMQSGGKRGVFITYTHVGAVLIGATLMILLIGWGCYVKGLSASLAQSAIKSIGPKPITIQHILRIDQPGREPITITSTISTPLLLGNSETPLGRRGVHIPLLGNGGEGDQATLADVPLSPESKSALLERFSQLAAEEASYMLSNNHPVADALELDFKAGSAKTSTSSSTASLSSSSSYFTSEDVVRNISVSDAQESKFDSSSSSGSNKRFIRIIEESDESDASEMEIEVKSVPVEAEKQDSSSESLDSTSSLNEESSSESKDVSASEPSASESSHEESTHNDVSDESSASSTSGATDTEVLVPFVCQSRFANEFLELSPLGKGGFGQVMLAENRLDGRKYAIKRVGLRLQNQTSKTLQKFLREVKILALLDHPNIVRYYQAWLEKIDCLDELTSSGVGSTTRPRDFSMSNILAPITEAEFSNNASQSRGFFSSSSGAEDDGFEWERSGENESAQGQGWTEADLATPKPQERTQRRVHTTIQENDSSSYSEDQCDHWLYIQMQYCAGHTLGDYLMLPDRPPELSKILKIFTQIASAIAHVHSCGLIHRDLKPANIFVADTESDSIKLGDFGLSRYAANVNLTSQTTNDEQAMALRSSIGEMSTSRWSKSVSSISESNDVTAGVGTALYASPEQAAGKKYNAKTDIFSLGMILFEMCHDRFTTTMERYTTLANARSQIFPTDFVWETKCPKIMVMLRRLLSYDPMERPDASEVVEWSETLRDASLVQEGSLSAAMLRSPHHLPNGLHGSIPPLMMDFGRVNSTFALEVEARPDVHDAVDGDNRLPNHNLLKEICDLIAHVSDGRTEIKKCGLHLQDDGGQILEFVLDSGASREGQSDADARRQEQRERVDLVAAIQDLPSVHFVRMDVSQQ